MPREGSSWDMMPEAVRKQLVLQIVVLPRTATHELQELDVQRAQLHHAVSIQTKQIAVGRGDDGRRPAIRRMLLGFVVDDPRRLLKRVNLQMSVSGKRRRRQARVIQEERQEKRTAQLRRLGRRSPVLRQIHKLGSFLGLGQMLLRLLDGGLVDLLFLRVR
eukprot:scaffold115_cov241-Pinguiococcus_pyrenoidosus.AAC.17